VLLQSRQTELYAERPCARIYGELRQLLWSELYFRGKEFAVPDAVASANNLKLILEISLIERQRKPGTLPVCWLEHRPRYPSASAERHRLPSRNHDCRWNALTLAPLLSHRRYW